MFRLIAASRITFFLTEPGSVKIEIVSWLRLLAMTFYNDIKDMSLRAPGPLAEAVGLFDKETVFKLWKWAGINPARIFPVFHVSIKARATMNAPINNYIFNRNVFFFIYSEVET